MITELAGRRISPIGLGTYGMGGRHSADRSMDQEHADAISFAIENGITFIDTAEAYSEGHSEELVGRAAKKFPRENLFITTKVWPNHLKHDDVIRSTKASLARLDCEYIDLLLIHWPNPSVPVSETLGAMEELADQGFVRSIGVSNFNADQLGEAIESTSSHRIAANQIPYSLDNRSAEKDIIPFCENNEVAVIAYSPLNRGHALKNRALGNLAREIGKSPAAVALNYLMKRSVPIPKSVRKEHIMQFVEAMSFELSDEQYGKLAES